MCTYQNFFTEEALFSETNLFNGGNNSECPFPKCSLRGMNFSQQPLSYSSLQCQPHLGCTDSLSRVFLFCKGSPLGCIYQQLLVIIGDFEFFFFFTKCSARRPISPSPGDPVNGSGVFQQGRITF